MPAENPVRELMRRELLARAAYGSIQERIELYEPFYNRPILAADLDPSTINQAAVRLLTGANRHWVISGTNAANAGSALDVDGGVSLTTAGANNDQIILAPAGAINSIEQSPWGRTEWEPEHESRFECLLELPSIAAAKVHAGFGLSAVLDQTTDADQCKFVFNTGGAVSVANWTAVTSIAGTDDEDDTDEAAAASTSVRLGIRIDSDRVPTFWIDGVEVHEGSALAEGANLIPFIGIQALTAAAKTLKVRWVRCSRLIN